MRDPQVTSKIMAAVKSRNTKPEVALRKALWHRGLRYRLHSRLTGHPDIVFPGARVVIFVDGDFWHGNAWRVRGMKSFDEQFLRHNNPEFWRKKITANMSRDQKVNDVLSREGWTVYRVFESRLNKDFSAVVLEIEELVRSSANMASPASAEREDGGANTMTSKLEDPCRDR